LVNYRMRGDYYVVDRLFDAAELRLGEKHQDIVRITRGGGKKLRRNTEKRP
jgi:type IV secretion system protein TrbG